MTCSGCTGAVERVLKRIEGVELVNTELDSQTVTIKGKNLSKEVLVKAIEKTGKKIIG
jgi:copper chaperone